jgi:MFS family permease
VPPAEPDSQPAAPTSAGVPAAAAPAEPPPARFALTPATAAILSAGLLVNMAGELAAPLLPDYLARLKTSVVLIGLYGTLKDAVEAVNYLLGGAIAGRLNTRRALLLFNALPLVGVGMMLTWYGQAWAVFAAVPFLGVWDALSQPAALAVIGDNLPPAQRTAGVSYQSVSKRLARLIAYAVTGFALAADVRWALAASGVLIAFGLFVQWKWMTAAVADRGTVIHRPFAAVRAFPRELKRLLAADIIVRWCEGLPRELIILFCVPVIASAGTGDPDAARGLYVGVLLNIMVVAALVSYLPTARLSSTAGMIKKPYIGLSFLFFSLFPTAAALGGTYFGFAGLAAAFVVGGFREIGEPARKAMVTELVPPEYKSQLLGVYWGVRSLAVCAAPLTGGAVYYFAEELRPGSGFLAVTGAATAVGLAGTAYFFARFGAGGAANEPIRQG